MPNPEVDTPAPITTAVFIDANVSDLAALLAGLLPGERAFVVKAGKDGLDQIAHDLRKAHLSSLSAIDIVAHGASGSFALGSSTVGDGDLSQHAQALKAIGKALAPGGRLALYACDVAAGSAGRTFITDLSHYAGSKTVDAATHDIGLTPNGENWTLDASTASATPVATASPFSAASTQNYAATLASGDSGQLLITSGGNTYNDSYLNSDGTSGVTAPGTANNPSISGVAVDQVLGLKIADVFDDANGYNNRASQFGGNTGDDQHGLFAGPITAAVPAHDQADWQGYYTSQQPDGNSLRTDVEQGQTALGFNAAIDPSTHTIYQPVGSGYASENGILSTTYSVDGSGNVSFTNIKFLQTSTYTSATEAPTGPSYFLNSVYANNNLYVTDSNGLFGASGSDLEDGLYRFSTTASGQTNPVQLVTAGQVNGKNSNGVINTDNVIDHVTFDNANNRVYFDTLPYGSSGATTLYAVSNASTATAATAPTPLTYAAGVNVNNSLFSAPTPKANQTTSETIQGLAFDANTQTLYVANEKEVVTTQGSTTTYDFSQSEIDELHLDKTGTNVTSVTQVPITTFAGSSVIGAFQAISFDSLPNLTVAGTTAKAAINTPVSVLSAAPTIVDYDNGGYVSNGSGGYTSGGYLSSATVKVTDTTSGAVVTTDKLGLVEGGVFKTFTSTPTTQTDNGNTFLVSYSSSSGLLTIANQATGSTGENTIAAYKQVLADVQYENTANTSDNRTITVEVNDGATGNPSGSYNQKGFTLSVAAQPVIVSGGAYSVPSQVVAGASASATAGGPASAPTAGALAGDSDPNGTGLSITALQSTAIASGGSAQATGTYGSLTLSSNGSYTYAASYTTAITNAKTGSHPTDSYSFTVTNAGGSVGETFTATIDRAPTGTGITVTAPQGASTSGTAKAAFANDTDADGTNDIASFTVASLSHNTTAAVSSSGTFTVAGQYGTLMLGTNGSYTYTALAAPTASSASPLKDDFTYTVADAGGATSQAQTLEFDVVCYASGTRIRTVRGDVAVEQLAVGDLVVTASGARRPIRWLGHRTIDCRRTIGRLAILPIRIAASAFGPDKPTRDLLVSPGHAICVDVCGEVLIPANALVNGSTIQQVEVDEVTYWHVELDSHDILLAENLPAESYLDVGNRSFFVEEGVVSLASSPDAAIRTCADFCRPFHSGGPLVDTVRLQLDRRATAMGTRDDMKPADARAELRSVKAA